MRPFEPDQPPDIVSPLLEFLLAMRGYMIVAIALIAIGLLLMWARPAHAEEVWVKPDLPCTPGLSDFARASGSQGLVAAGVWWCDLPDGLHMRYATYTFGSASELLGAMEAAFSSGGEDIGPEILKFWRRPPTAAEMEVVTRIELKHQPHCYVVGSAATAAVLVSTAQGTIGAAKMDAAGVGIRAAVAAPVSCYGRLAKETVKRYCAAENLTDTKGRRIDGDAWVACKIERAPGGGWQ